MIEPIESMRTRIQRELAVGIEALRTSGLLGAGGQWIKSTNQ